jgi:hypothetical protein
VTEKRAIIRFGDGSMLELSHAPEEIVQAIEQSKGGLIKVLDSNNFPAWFNPTYVVSVASHDEHKRTVAETPSRL